MPALGDYAANLLGVMLANRGEANAIIAAINGAAVQGQNGTFANVIISGGNIFVPDNIGNALDIISADLKTYVSIVTTDNAESIAIGKFSTCKLGFFGVTPASRVAAYTQTFATASRTHDVPTATAPTVNVIGATNTGDVSGTIKTNDDNLRQAIINLIADVANIKQVLNSVIDDGQGYGLLA